MATTSEKLDLILELLEQQGKDIAELKAAKSVVPVVTSDPDAEYWKKFLSDADPDPNTWQPESFTSYARSRVLMQMRAGYNVRGVRTYADVYSRMSLVRALWDQNLSWANLFEGARVLPETAVYGILGGHLDELVDWFKRGWQFNSQAQGQVSILAGKTAADLFASDIKGAVPGGTPGGGGNDSSTGTVPPRQG